MAGLGAGLLLFVVVFAAAAATGLTGFGFNLVSVPLLALLLDTHLAVVLSLALGVVASALLLLPADTRREVDGRLALTLFAFSLFGLPVGLLIFTRLSPGLLKLTVGAVTLAYVVPLLGLYGGRLRLHRFMIGIAGVLSGVLASSTGLSGPPAIVFVHSQQLPPSRLRATLALYVLLVTTATLPLLAIAGSLNAAVLRTAGPLAVAVIGGICAGRFAFGRLPGHHFDKVVVGGLVAMAISNLVSGGLSAA